MVFKSSLLNMRSLFYFYFMVIGKSLLLNMGVQAEEYLCDMEKMPLLVDPSLKGDFDIEDLVALCDIARVCVEVTKGTLLPPYLSMHNFLPQIIKPT